MEIGGGLSHTSFALNGRSRSGHSPKGGATVANKEKETIKFADFHSNCYSDYYDTTEINAVDTAAAADMTTSDSKPG